MSKCYRVGALAYSALVAGIVKDETKHSGHEISIVVTGNENALADAAMLFDMGMEALLCHG